MRQRLAPAQRRVEEQPEPLRGDRLVREAADAALGDQRREHGLVARATDRDQHQRGNCARSRSMKSAALPVTSARSRMAIASGRATSSSASTCGVRASTTTPRVATAPAITSRSVASSLRATKVLEPVPAGARVAVIGGSGSGSASGAGNDTGIGSVMDLVAANGLGNRSYREYHDSARPEATPRGRLHGDSVKCGRVSLRECDARHPAPCWRRKRSGGTPAWRRKKREK
ncbi:MAG: hypothetical protein U1F11_14325 [Steroidobacteraceae bacterium]